MKVFFNPSCKSSDVIFGLQTARWLKIEAKKKVRILYY